jgi:uncharacterized integral membrane protein
MQPPRPPRSFLRLFGWFISVPVTILVLLVAVMNRLPVTFSLWPLPDIEAPLFLLVFGAVFIGFLFGALAMWVSGGATRRKLRAARRAAETASVELAQARRQGSSLTTRNEAQIFPPAA